MGLINDSLGGRHSIAHGGGISGFLTDMVYFPDGQLTIAVLENTAGPVSPTAVLNAIAALIHGRYTPPASMALDHPAADYVGTFRGVGRGDSLSVAVITDSTVVRFRVANATSPDPRLVTLAGTRSCSGGIGSPSSVKAGRSQPFARISSVWLRG